MMRLRLLCAASALALASHAYAQSCGAGEHCFAQPVRLNSDYSWTGGVFHPDLDTSGTISDDARLQAAINSCAAVGGTVYLPAGNILLTGAAGTTDIHNCQIIGSGGPLDGTTIELTSTTVKPFTFGIGWSIRDVNFYWPNQTGTVVYPALFTADSTVVNFSLINDSVINAYTAIDFPAGGQVGIFWIRGGDWYAVHTLLQVASVIGSSDHLSDMHMGPDSWFDRCGGLTPTCKGYVDAGSTGNSVLHILNGGNVQFFWSNSADFDWRYGILEDNGGYVTSSRISIAWDGTGTILDTSASTSPNGWNYSDRLDATGHSLCGFHYNYTEDGASDAYYPCFNLGADTALYLNGGTWSSQSDLIDMSGGWFAATGAVLQAARLGLTSNIYVVNATGAAPMLNISDDRIDGYGGSPYIQGISVSGVTGVGNYQITDNNFTGLASAVSMPTGSPEIIAGNYSSDMDDTADVTFSDASYGVYWHDNAFEFPPAASVSACGTGATVSGALSGVITVGATVPTTSCKLVLPFNPPGETAGSCVFSGVPTTIAAVAAAKPPQWTLTFGADVHGDTVSYNCAGNQ